MPTQKISCLYRGNTFFGTFRASLEGSESTVVTVHYNGGAKAAASDGFPIADVAEALLLELVVREAVARERPEWRLMQSPRPDGPALRGTPR